MALFWRADIEAGEVVWLFTGFDLAGGSFVADVAVYLDSIHELLSASPPDIVPVGIQIVERGSPTPDAETRKLIADRTSVLPRSDSLYCMVSDNAIARGTLTAINWIRRPPYRFAVKRNFADGVAWADQVRGYPSRSLNRLYQEVVQEAEQAERGLLGGRTDAAKSGSPLG